MAYSILSLFLSSLFALCYAQLKITDRPKLPSPIFYLNSTLQSITWLNEYLNVIYQGSDGSKTRTVLVRQMSEKSLAVMCGFYCIDTCTYYFFSVVVAGGNDLSVVWSANRGHPVPQNTILQVAREEGLVLLNSDGLKIWSTDTSSVAGINISSSGNLILFNDEGLPVWQSFDHPTDTLLVGQKLKEGQRLTVSSSQSNWSQGPYYVTITLALGFAAYTEVDKGPPLMYYQLLPTQNMGSADELVFAEFSQVGLLVKLGTRAQWNYGEYNVIPSSDGVILFLKLTFFNVIDLGAAFANIKDIDQCKQACLQNCSCGAAFFSYQNIRDDGYCFLPVKMLSNRESTFPHTDFSYRTYIKVQIPHDIPELAPQSPPSVKKSNFTVIIAGSSAGAFVILCIMILMLSMIRRRNNIGHDEECIGQIPGMPMRFSYEELRFATEEFKEKIGGGGVWNCVQGKARRWY